LTGDNELIRHRFVEIRRHHLYVYISILLFMVSFFDSVFTVKMSILSLELIDINPISGSLSGLLTIDN